MSLATHGFDLPIMPGSISPVLHLSQYDDARTFTAHLKDENGNAFTLPSGATAKLEGMNCKGVTFEINATPSGSDITFTPKEAATDQPGLIAATLHIKNSNDNISTLAVILNVQKAGATKEEQTRSPGFTDAIQAAVEAWASQQGFTSPTVSITDIEGGHRVTFTDAEHPQGQSIDVMDGEDTGVVTDDTLSIEGAAADAAAVGALRDVTLPAAYTVEDMNVDPVLVTVETSGITQRLGVGGSANQANFVGGEYYDVSTDAIKPKASGSRNVLYFAVKPGSKLKVDIYILVNFYDMQKKFISGVSASSAAYEITVPNGAYYARFSSQQWDASAGGYPLTSRFNVLTNCLVKDIYYRTNTLHTAWENVEGREEVDAAIEDLEELNAVFERYPILIPIGAPVKLCHGKYYYSNVSTSASGTNVGNLAFYDADKNLIPCLTKAEWGELGYNTNTAVSGGVSPIPSSNLWDIWSNYTQFKVDGKTVTCYNMHGTPRTAVFDLSETPAYVALFKTNATGEGYPRWTLGQREADIGSGVYYVVYDEDNPGLIDQIKNDVVTGILENASSSELGRWMKFNAIKEANRKIHAFRVASFNIYGAGQHKANWTRVKEAIQNFGVDLIGFQEVYDPLGTLTDELFASTMMGWHLSQFSDSALFAGNSRIVAATSDFVFVGAEEVKYTQQANYGDRYYVRAEFRLPMWKHKNWSHYIKVSVYNTQLEVGTSTAYTNTRLAQAAELIAAMQADTNPFVILVGDFNEMSTDRSTFAAIAAAGFTPVLADDSTPTASRGYYDNIFINDRISIVDSDVIPYSDMFLYPSNQLSDHDLVFADLVFDYSNIIAVKKAGDHCTISGVEDWLDRRQTEPVVVTVTADSGYTVSAISCGQGNNDLTYNNGAVVKSGNTITIKPNLVIGDVWITVTTVES